MIAAKEPKYQEIKRELLREIERGTYGPGTTLPSEAQLLERFGVSRPTVVRSLQDLVREGVVTRQQGRGTFVSEDYVRRVGRAARPTPIPAVQSAPNGNVPVFISDDTASLTGAAREVLLRLLRGAEAMLTQAGASLLLRNVPPDTVTDETLSLLDAMDPGPVLLVEPSFTPALLEELVKRDWSVVSVNEPCADADSVYIDQDAAGYLATRHLLDQGCRRVALLNGPVGHYWGFDARRTGYRRALAERKLPFDEELYSEAIALIDSESGRAMVRALLRAEVEFDGLVGATDSKSLGAWAALEEAGKRIPEQVRIVSIDNTVAGRSDKQLPSVTMPFEMVGRRAARLAVDQHALRLQGEAWFRVDMKILPALVSPLLQ